MNHTDLKECDGNTAASVLDAAFEVHRQLGPGLLESVYELALTIELTKAGFSAQRQVEIPVSYKGCELGMGFRADIIVENSLLLEIKAVDEFNDVHLAQVMTYLKILGFKRGYLLNFNRRMMKEGIKRVSI